MVSLMTSMPEHDYIQSYEASIKALAVNPGDRDMQYKAVLALARMGSLDFALKEYERYNMHNVQNHEDIMSLSGRLSKDLHLATKGKTSLDYALSSAEKYEEAYQKTQGYYSGINAATMAFLANMPLDIVTARVSNILGQLPPPENLSPQDHYFIEATRAECFLLLQETEKVKEILQGAIAFDPLNYAAHATTLKQFKLILEKRREDQSWLANFQPPRPVHYAGNIWDHSDSSNLALKVSDLIQQQDIGFGYGALAAGADIVIAEALLLEGVELNVFLPSSIDSFIAHSVKPFGDAWVPRFKACLQQAYSCTCLPDSGEGVNQAQNILVAQMAMGQAILRSHHIGVAPSQILMRAPNSANSLTNLHGVEWKAAGLDQLYIDVNKDFKLGKARLIKSEEFSVLVKSSAKAEFETASSFKSAMSEFFESPKDDKVMFGLTFDLSGAETELEAIMSRTMEGTIFVSEAVASYAALKHKQDYKVTFAGTSLDKTGKAIRSYTLQSLT